jgi:hypothetical protein
VFGVWNLIFDFCAQQQKTKTPKFKFKFKFKKAWKVVGKESNEQHDASCGHSGIQESVDANRADAGVGCPSKNRILHRLPSGNGRRRQQQQEEQSKVVGRQ